MRIIGHAEEVTKQVRRRLDTREHPWAANHALSAPLTSRSKSTAYSAPSGVSSCLK